MANVTHRTTEEAIYDGSTGNQIDTQVNHQIGVEIDGVFVPFLTKQGGYVDALVSRGQADQQAAAAQQPTQTASGSVAAGTAQTPEQQQAAPASPPDEHAGQAQ